MALERHLPPHDDVTAIRPGSATTPIGYDQSDIDSGRSNFAAFLLGGVMIAGGLLAFLYYDTDNLTRGDSLTTGSITQTVPRDVNQGHPALRIPVQPAQPSTR